MKKVNRVKKYREFKAIMDLRKFKRNEIYSVYFRNKQEDVARVGILVGKRNGNAVTRVKIKRQVRSIVDETLDLPNDVYDYIIVISKNYNVEEFAKNKSLLVTLLNSIKEK